jgi:hypothetical protein
VKPQFKWVSRWIPNDLNQRYPTAGVAIGLPRYCWTKPLMKGQDVWVAVGMLYGMLSGAGEDGSTLGKWRCREGAANVVHDPAWGFPLLAARATALRIRLYRSRWVTCAR